MKTIIFNLLLLTPFVLLANSEFSPKIHVAHGSSQFKAEFNSACTPEQKEAFMAKLKQLAQETNSKLQELMNENPAILNMYGRGPIITLVCQWVDIEKALQEESSTDHSSAPTTLPSSNAS